MKKLIVANWKMNCTTEQANTLLQQVRNIHCNNDVVLCPSFLHLYLAKDLGLVFGAQNCAATENGAFTGEVSAAMLTDIGCQYVILGHSERRQLQNESDQLIRNKLITALGHKLIPIVCIGEPLDVYKSRQTHEYVKKQLQTLDLPAREIVIAYEPIWAIGSGLTPSTAEVANTLAHIKSCTENRFKTLYGGSVSDKNCNELAAIKDLDGFLVGGASLKFEQFQIICRI